MEDQEETVWFMEQRHYKWPWMTVVNTCLACVMWLWCCSAGAPWRHEWWRLATLWTAAVQRQGSRTCNAGP